MALEAPPRSFDRLLAMAHADGLTVARALARTVAALGDGAAARPDEAWAFDAEAGRFSVTTTAGEVLFGWPCTPIARYRDDTLTWATDAAASSPLQTMYADSAELTPWLSQPSFAVADGADAQVVTTWLAARAGYTGCFPAREAGTTTYFAVLLTGLAAVGQGNRPWCSACGTMQRAAGRLLAAGEGVALCDACGSTLAVVLADTPGSDAAQAMPVAVGAWPTLRYCLFCGEPRGGLIIVGPAGICRECAGFAVDVLRG